MQNAAFMPLNFFFIAVILPDFLGEFKATGGGVFKNSASANHRNIFASARKLKKATVLEEKQPKTSSRPPCAFSRLATLK